MSKEQAAIADVVAKMRRFADRHWMHHACQVVREFADMIDFALKRDCEVVVSKNATTTKESLAVGNAAKLREALGELRAELWNNTVIAGKKKFALYEIADAALAAPPRNCDVGTAEEQRDRFNAFCTAHNDSANCHCPCDRESGACHFIWAQMPYDESGACNGK